jgi:phage terminase large subunit GpA-like protein
MQMLGARTVLDIPALPPFVRAEDLALDELVLLDPPSRLTVTEAAALYMRVDIAGNWAAFDPELTAYMVEPANQIGSRRWNAVCFVGPSQSGKTKMLEAAAVHAITCDPGPVHIVHMTRPDANAWVEEKLDPMISNSPAVRARLGAGRDDNTFSRKRFRGCRVTIGYPVATQLSGRSLKQVLLTDYDHMPAQLGPKDRPEGSPYGMARQRTKTFGSRGCVLVESTPAYPVRRDAPAARGHAFPETTGGIVRIYNEGTKGRFHWQCRDCDGLFEASHEHLEYDADLPAVEAAQAAVMVCPNCGSVIAPRHKPEFNRAALTGRGGWLHEAADGAHVQIGDSALDGVDVASYALNGAAAAFSTWSDIVLKLERARAQVARYDDETDLAQVHYTDLGVPYALERDRSAEDALTLTDLRDMARPLPRGIAPVWTRCVTVSVDVQKARFPVSVTAWGDDGERAIIDAFDLIAPPADAPSAEGRPLSPARYAEDWAVLEPLADRVFHVDDQAYGLKPLAIVVDFHGEAGVSDNAEKFLRARLKDGQRGLWFLSRGRGGFNVPTRVWHEAPERGSKGKKARAIKLLNLATDRLKDSILPAIARREDGPGALHWGDWLADDRLEELIAEERTASGYDKRPGVTRNELLDGQVQALGVFEFLGGKRINPAAAPAKFACGPENIRAVEIDAEAIGPVPAQPAAPPAPRRARKIRFLQG